MASPSHELAQSGDGIDRILLREKMTAAHGPAANVRSPLTQHTERSTNVCVPLVQGTAHAPQREHRTLNDACRFSIRVIVRPIGGGSGAVLFTDGMDSGRGAKCIHIFLAYVGGKSGRIGAPFAQRIL